MTSLLPDIDRLCKLLSQAAEGINNTNDVEVLTTQLYINIISLHRRQVEEGLMLMANNATKEELQIPESLLQ